MLNYRGIAHTFRQPASISIWIFSPSRVITFVGDPFTAAFLITKFKPIKNVKI